MTEQNRNEKQSEVNREETNFDDAILNVEDDPLTIDVEKPASELPASKSEEVASGLADPQSSPRVEEDAVDDLVEDDLVEQEDVCVPAKASPQQTQQPVPSSTSGEKSGPIDAAKQGVSSSLADGAPTAEKPQSDATSQVPEGTEANQAAVFDIRPADDAVALHVKVSGIDLGTTYSAISSYSATHERVETLPLNQIAEGQPVVPSVVYYPEDGDPVVGTSAVNMKNVESDRVIEAVKRAMGTNWTKVLGNRTLTAESVSADILTAVYSEASRVVGKKEKRVVITVPAYFEDAERAATRKAGESAGLEVLALLPEPHAAALAFTVERVSGTVESKTADLLNRYLMVFDLGGGTLDVALIRIVSSKGENGQQSVRFETIFKDGNRCLGGLDWDAELEKVVLEKYRQQIGDEQYNQQTSNPNFVPMIRKEIERAKRTLSQLEKVKVPVLFNSVEVTRDEFEQATAGLLQRCLVKLEVVLTRAEKERGIRREDIPIVLAGGSTRMPQIPAMIERSARSKPLESSNPDLLVTTGAAYWAHLLVAGGSLPTGDGGGLTVKPEDTIQIVNYSVGVKTFDQDGKGEYTVPVYTEIIPRESRCGPAGEEMETRLDRYLADALEGYRRTSKCPGSDAAAGIFADLFYKNRDGMTRIPVIIYSSEEAKPALERARKMGEVYIMGLPPNGKKGQPVLIALGHDADGILRGRSIDVESGRSERIVIKRESQLS